MSNCGNLLHVLKDLSSHPATESCSSELQRPLVADSQSHPLSCSLVCAQQLSNSLDTAGVKVIWACLRDPVQLWANQW